MLNEQGFKRKRYSDLLTEIEERARTLFGEDINTTLRSPLGILIRLFAWFLSLVWQNAEEVYHSGFRDTATGVSLDKLGAADGIYRLPENAAIGVIEVDGKPFYEVLEDTIVGTEQEVWYRTIDSLILDDKGKGTVQVTAMKAGTSGNVPSNRITRLLLADSNITTVTNPSPTSEGRELETDKEYRERLKKAKAGLLNGALYKVPGVRSVTIIENKTMQPDAEGRNPKSFEVFVLGGNDREVAQAIFENKPAGIETHGGITQEITDLSGEKQIITFSRTENVPVWIKAILTTSSAFLLDGADKVRTEIVQVIGGQDEDGVNYEGMKSGQNVIINQLIGAVMKVEGIEDVEIKVSTDSSTFHTQNIPIEKYKKAVVHHSNIEVTTHV
ncbi:baseplate protein [Brevibacillus sp. VP]|uniref:baseplate J/gp47 family protein n=1 Tax=Brevibacillus sp. VP TaxID=2293326 RepID=UPI000E2EB365|nr:baseplate J/gp47 family protein [Brevibacillus sp. VP]RFB32003.1 baseplate protein [Brevibacillus sp. VP]